jgi:hypothetical protein
MRVIQADRWLLVAHLSRGSYSQRGQTGNRRLPVRPINRRTAQSGHRRAAAPGASRTKVVIVPPLKLAMVKSR